jgi:Protein of unknown function (DUF4236)
MGFRFRKSIKILPGVRLNVGKKGINSVSVGGHGATTNIGRHGTHTTYSIPGTGISYRTGSHKSGSDSTGFGCCGVGFFGFIALAFLSTFSHHDDNALTATSAETSAVTTVESLPTPVARLADKNTAIEENALQTTPASSVRRHRRTHQQN